MTKYFIYLLAVLSFYSCVENDTEYSKEMTIEKPLTITIERGYLFHSMPYELRYFSFEKLKTDSSVNYIYTIDSIQYLNDSLIVTGEELGYYNGYKVIYYQSAKKDTLFSFEKNSFDPSLFNYYSLVDSINISHQNSDFVIYKYNIPHPDVDGDFTIYFNNKIGFIESYNCAWKDRKTIQAHPNFSSELTQVITRIKKDTLFYNPIKPMPISEIIKK